MARVIIIGDGPAGLSAALFLAKNGQDVTVFAQDETPMHYAKLYNYLGIPEITGSDFQKVAREQVAKFGTKLMAEKVTGAEQAGSGFHVTTAGGSYDSDYLIIAEGKGLKIADQMGLPQTEQGVEVDHNYRSAVAKLYVVGRSVRKTRSQAVISAGTGATAALDILATEKGQDFVDYDSVS
jgi:thioredoxin reductase